jgi:Fuc2NAc and GlcNAc transferase
MKSVSLLVAISGAASLVFTGVVRGYAIRRGLLDHPNLRSSHTVPTPRGGGVAILAAADVGIVLGVAFQVVLVRDALTLGIGMLALGIVGWVDDRGGLQARVRLAMHFGVALWTVYMFNGFPSVRTGTASLAIGVAGYVVGAVGIVWSINLFNFMDGIDGLAGSQAVLIFGVAAVLLFDARSASLASVAAVAAAATGGFLIWNWPPAKIFLGDAGSGSIGYLIAGIALASENRRAVPLLAFAIIGGVFIADATVTLLRRIARQDRLTEAHRDHAYQRLARAWRAHKPVTIAAAALTVLLGILGAHASLSPALLLPDLLVAYCLLAVVLFVIERRAPL